MREIEKRTRRRVAVIAAGVVLFGGGLAAAQNGDGRPRPASAVSDVGEYMSALGNNSYGDTIARLVHQDIRSKDELGSGQENLRLIKQSSERNSRIFVLSFGNAPDDEGALASKRMTDVRAVIEDRADSSDENTRRTSKELSMQPTKGIELVNGVKVVTERFESVTQLSNGEKVVTVTFTDIDGVVRVVKYNFNLMYAS